MVQLELLQLGEEWVLYPFSIISSINLAMMQWICALQEVDRREFNQVHAKVHITVHAIVRVEQIAGVNGPLHVLNLCSEKPIFSNTGYFLFSIIFMSYF